MPPKIHPSLSTGYFVSLDTMPPKNLCHQKVCHLGMKADLFALLKHAEIMKHIASFNVSVHGV
uniref:Uncharacterized protein F21H12.3 n=1 Tax=Caenorhabditis elegans TaxID=6239 RepID=YQS3_CAEEL|nr:RecName: Full=Uncharacterized protein F21H12.3 [Caenorhabditis elegans]